MQKRGAEIVRGMQLDSARTRRRSVSSQRERKDDITQVVAYRLHVRLAHKMAVGSESVRTGA